MKNATLRLNKNKIKTAPLFHFSNTFFMNNEKNIFFIIVDIFYNRLIRNFITKSKFLNAQCFLLVIIHIKINRA